MQAFCKIFCLQFGDIKKHHLNALCCILYALWINCKVKCLNSLRTLVNGRKSYFAPTYNVRYASIIKRSHINVFDTLALHETDNGTHV